MKAMIGKHPDVNYRYIKGTILKGTESFQFPILVDEKNHYYEVDKRFLIIEKGETNE